MAKKLNRRAVIAAAGALAVTPTAISPALASVPAAPADSLPSSIAAMRHMAEEGGDLHIVEVQGNAFAPNYRRGDLLFIQPKVGKAQDHMVIRRKAGPASVGVLVHRDTKALYIRGLLAGDRMQAVPFKAISEWGRVAIAYRA